MGYIFFQKLLIDKCGKQIYNRRSLTFSSDQHSHEWKYQGFFTVFSKPWNTVSSVPAWRVSLVWCPSSQVSADMSLLFGVPRTPQCPPLTVLPECLVSTLPKLSQFLPTGSLPARLTWLTTLHCDPVPPNYAYLTYTWYTQAKLSSVQLIWETPQCTFKYLHSLGFDNPIFFCKSWWGG